jgi:hypothetical protein
MFVSAELLLSQSGVTHFVIFKEKPLEMERNGTVRTGVGTVPAGDERRRGWTGNFELRGGKLRCPNLSVKEMNSLAASV